MLKKVITDHQLIPHPHYFLFYYIGRQDGNDPLSVSFLFFKKDTAQIANAWIDCAVTALKELSLDRNAVVIRALHSHETHISSDSNTPLDRLCQCIATTYHCTYLPQLLSKSKPTQPLHRLPSINSRQAELHDVYQFTKDITILKNKSILLVDDAVTTGLTARNIIGAVKTSLPEADITIFSLAKTDFNPDINRQLQLQGEKYTWDGIKWVDKTS